jgi:hypothetical protein
MTRDVMTHDDMVTSAGPAVPRRIFSYWDKGFDSAPEIVQLCVSSWRHFNPDYEFVLLDAWSAADMFPELFGQASFQRSNVQVQSDLLRLHAVTRMGGIWLDTTVFLTKPLDLIVNSSLPSCFLAVKTDSGSNRFFQSYFLASVPGAPFPVEWLRRYQKYRRHETSEMPRRFKKRLRKRIPFLFSSPAGTTVWTIPFLGRLVGHPYLVPHFIANRMILFSRGWRRVYDTMPTLRAVTGIHLSPDPDGIQKVRELLQADQLHVWKLDWKDPANYPDFWAETQTLLRDYLANQP